MVLFYHSLKDSNLNRLNMMFTITGGNSVAGYQLETAFGLGMGACIYFTSQHLAYPRRSPLYSVTGSMSSCVLKSFVWKALFPGSLYSPALNLLSASSSTQFLEY